MTPAFLKSHLLHPSGGLLWHWRALRNRHHWQPLFAALDTWLQEWITQLPDTHRHLVLIGPSAGWTLPMDRFDRFDSITLFEPDVLARLRWRTRHEKSRLHFDFHDVFSPDGMRYLHDCFPAHAILFCNVLGQLSPTDPEDANRWCASLRTQLHDRCWASYHDWASTRQPPTAFATHRQFPAQTTLETALGSFWRDSEIEISDHNTSALSEHIPFSCIPWRLRKNQWHLIQWVSHISTR